MRTIFSLFVSLFALLCAETAQADNLQDELRIMIDHHPRTLSARADLGRAVSAKQEAFSGFLPTVDVSAGIGRENTDRTGLLPKGARTNENAENYSATVTENLFSGFRTQAAVATANLNAQLADLSLASTRQQVLYEGASTYST